MSTIDDLTTATLTKVAPMIERGDVSPIDLTQAMLDRIAHLGTGGRLAVDDQVNVHRCLLVGRSLAHAR